MSNVNEKHAATRDAVRSTLPVAPSLQSTLALARMLRGGGGGVISPRTLFIALLATVIGLLAAGIAQLLTASLAFVTNLAFFGRFSLQAVSPADNRLGYFVVLVPVVGALLIGLMARYGSMAIRGHGIPEAMEKVLFGQSRIPARVLLLKPLSAIISIGTGGPFGAEGPIIATGGALGSLIGQFAEISAEERKILLASGAAAGMSATFGSPIAAVLLAIELLLFEYRARSVVPVAFAAAAAAAVRISLIGGAPAFDVGVLQPPAGGAILAYVLIGAAVGVFSVVVTKAVYAVEDLFERLPIHWMWWPALGAIPVGVIGILAPRTLGVGYDNIEQMVSGQLAGATLFALCGFKLVSWLFSLGSGTSGGTLAPLFTIGGGAGAACAVLLNHVAPQAGVDPRLGALVGMAAMFAGASRALLASVIFAFETTRQAPALLPLLGACSAAYLVSCLIAKNSIMTEKIVRRGYRVPMDYSADFLAQVSVSEVGERAVDALQAEQTLAEVRLWLAQEGSAQQHQGFPVLSGQSLVGVVTRRQLFAPNSDPETRLAALINRPPVTIAATASLRDAADVMAREGIGRLPVLKHGRLVGILTRSDVLQAHTVRLTSEHDLRRVRRVALRSAT